MTGSSSTTSSMTGTTRKTTSDKLSGVNNCLKCVPITDDKYDDVIKHLRDSFFVDEPLNKAVGLCKRGEPHEELEKYCRLTLAQKFSCMVIDENGQIAGTALNGIIKNGEREEAERRLAELKDEKFRSIFRLLYKINEKINLFNKYEVDELFETRILSVNENYRGRGLSNILLEKSLEIAKNYGFKVFKVEATGLFSQKVYLKYGFQIIHEIPYSEVDERLNPGPPHEALKLMVKVLD